MKFSLYNYFIDKGKEIILYNTYTQNALKLTTKKDINLIKKLLSAQNISKRSKLAQNLIKYNFLISKDIDEYEIVKKKIEENYICNMTLRLHIYVTNQCNFRCIYCPEEHTTSVFSQESWNALYEFIKKELKRKDYKRVQISFFGGEPLLSYNAIVHFLEKLKKLSYKYKDILFEHMITTNAYLLKPEWYDKLVSLGVIDYQITIDGMAKKHNENRPLANGNDTWATIIKNIEYINLKYDDAYIFIRANVNEKNFQSVEKFFEFFDETFYNRKFTLYIHPVSNFSELVNEEDTIKITNLSYIDLENKLCQKHKRYLKTRYNCLCLLSRACKCANPNFYSINTDNQVSKCEQFYGNREDSIIGYLDIEKGDIVINKNILQWDKYETEECKNCVIYPICGARRCPANKVQNQTYRTDCDYINGEYKTVIESNIKSMNFININS